MVFNWENFELVRIPKTSVNNDNKVESLFFISEFFLILKSFFVCFTVFLETPYHFKRVSVPSSVLDKFYSGSMNIYKPILYKI